MAGPVGLLIIGTGCSPLILAHQRSVGLDASADLLFSLGASRAEVETKLGKPVTSWALPDGGHVDTYKYAIRVEPVANISRETRPSEWPIWLFLALDAVSLGGTELVFAPAVAYDVSKNRRTATFTYDVNDRLLDHGPPPPYGPADDAVEVPSKSEIRERCRSEAQGKPRDVAGGVTGGPLTAAADLYAKCLVTQFAIWGIE